MRLHPIAGCGVALASLVITAGLSAPGSVSAAPPGDRYQIITEHPIGHVIAEDTGLGFQRTNAVTVIQIFQQGRSAKQKKAAYRELARRLEGRCDLAPTDLVVCVVANGRQDWSFGLGRAQFLEGDL